MVIPIYKKWWFYIIVTLCVLFLVVIIPIIINELYKVDNGYLTKWNASDVLAFYSELLSGLIAIICLIVTICFSKKDTEKQINSFKSQIKLPFLIIDSVKNMDDNEDFEILSDACWQKEYYFSNIKENEQISIFLKNIGEGNPVSPSWKLEKESKMHTVYIDNTNSLFVLKYAILTDLVCECKKSDSDVKTFDDIKLIYKNVFGVSFYQMLFIEYSCIKAKNIVQIKVKESLVQEILQLQK